MSAQVLLRTMSVSLWHPLIKRLHWVFLVLLFMASSCTQATPLLPASEGDRLEIMTTLEDRSFRKFDPSVDADRRKGVILDFSEPVSIWAQHAIGEYAVDEWEIVAHDYRIRRSSDFSEVVIHLEDAASRRLLPEECTDCIPTAGVSISIKDIFRRESTRFRINDPHNALPSPFPLFETWTEFPEDEYLHGG